MTALAVIVCVVLLAVALSGWVLSDEPAQTPPLAPPKVSAEGAMNARAAGLENNAQHLCDEHPAAKPRNPLERLSLHELRQRLASIEAIDEPGAWEKRRAAAAAIRAEFLRRSDELREAAMRDVGTNGNGRQFTTPFKTRTTL